MSLSRILWSQALIIIALSGSLSFANECAYLNAPGTLERHTPTYHTPHCSGFTDYIGYGCQRCVWSSVQGSVSCPFYCPIMVTVSYMAMGAYNRPPPTKFIEPRDPANQCGSIINVETQSLGEQIKISGTPYNLVYRSDRTTENSDAYSTVLNLSGSSIPSDTTSIDLEINIAGQVITQSFPPSTNLKHTFTWNGLDNNGTPIHTSEIALIKLWHRRSSDATTLGGAALSPATWKVSLGGWKPSTSGLLGWTIDQVHHFDSVVKKLYRGDGTTLDISNFYSDVITRYAGTGTSQTYSGDGGAATSAKFYSIVSLAADSQGNVYVGDLEAGVIGRVRKIDAVTKVITTVVGGVNGSLTMTTGGSQSATALRLFDPTILKIDSNDKLWIVDQNRVYKIDGTTAYHMAGNITGTPSTTIGDSASQFVYSVSGLVVDSSGAYYLSDSANGKIYYINNTNATTTTFYGAGSGYSGDGGPATSANMNPGKLAMNSAGDLFFLQGALVRKISSTGTISLYAGYSVGGTDTFYSNDGVAATSSHFTQLLDIQIGQDQNVYLLAAEALYSIDSSGTTRHLAGVGAPNPRSSSDSAYGDAIRASLVLPNSMAIDGEGRVYIGETKYITTSVSNGQRVKKIGPVVSAPLGSRVLSSEDGSEAYVFDSYGRLTKTIDTLTNLTKFSFIYGSHGLSTIADRFGNVTTIMRDSNGYPTQIIAPFGQTTTLTKNASGQLESVTDSNSNIYQMAYAGALLSTFTRPRGGSSSFNYSSGKLTKDTNHFGGYKALTRTNTSNGYNVPVTTQMGRVTNHAITFNSSGYRTRTITEPSGLSTTRSDSSNGYGITNTNYSATFTVATPALFSATAKRYSPSTFNTGGKWISRTNTDSVTLSDPGDFLGFTSRSKTFTTNSKTLSWSYNPTTRTQAFTSPGGRTTYVVMNSKGFVSQTETSGLTPIDFNYNSYGQLTQVTQGARSTSYTYDSAGLLATSTNPLLQTTSYSYDSGGRLTNLTFPDLSEVDYTYTADDLIETITPSGRSAHTFISNLIGTITDYIAPGSGSTTTTLVYNLDQQLTGINLPDGRTITNSYNSTTGNLISTTLNGIGSYSYNYSTANKLISNVTSPDGVVLSYSRSGETVTGLSWSGNSGGSILITYDNDLRVSSHRVGGLTISYAYDSDGLPTTIGALTQNYHSTTGLLTTSTVSNISDSYTRNSFGEWTDYEVTYSGTSIFDLSLTRDLLGRITSKTETIGSTANVYDYSYDSFGRLTAVSINGVPANSYSYGTSGTRSSATIGGVTSNATYDGQDRILSYGNYTYVFGANGDLQSKTDTSLSQTASYFYDHIGNLRSVTLPSGTVISYLADGENRRVVRAVNGTVVAKYVYQDGLRIAAVLDATNAVVMRFVYGAKQNVPEYMIKAGITYRFITDQLGSPMLLVDVSTGAVAQDIRYDEFGNVVSDSNPGFQPFGFAGGLYDADTKLVRFGARDYDPEVGRWTTKDPLLFAGGDTNLYGYVLQDPINFVDSEGLQRTPITGPGARDIGLHIACSVFKLKYACDVLMGRILDKPKFPVCNPNFQSCEPALPPILRPPSPIPVQPPPPEQCEGSEN